MAAVNDNKDGDDNKDYDDNNDDDDDNDKAKDDNAEPRHQHEQFNIPKVRNL